MCAELLETLERIIKTGFRLQFIPHLMRDRNDIKGFYLWIKEFKSTVFGITYALGLRELLYKIGVEDWW